MLLKPLISNVEIVVLIAANLESFIKYSECRSIGQISDRKNYTLDFTHLSKLHHRNLQPLTADEVVQCGAAKLMVGHPILTECLKIAQAGIVLLVLGDLQVRDVDLTDQVPIPSHIKSALRYRIALGGEFQLLLRLHEVQYLEAQVPLKPPLIQPDLLLNLIAPHGS